MVWKVADEGVVHLGEARTSLRGRNLPVRVVATFHEGQTVLSADYTLYYCAAGEEDVCLLAEGRAEMTVTVAGREAAREACLTLEIKGD